MKNLVKNFLVFFLVFLAIAAIFSTFSSQTKTSRVGIEALIQELNQDKVKSLVVSGNDIEIELQDGTLQVAQKEASESLSTLLSNFQLSPDKLEKVAISVKDESGWSYWFGIILPIALPLILIAAFFIFMMRGAQGMNIITIAENLGNGAIAK